MVLYQLPTIIKKKNCKETQNNFINKNNFGFFAFKNVFQNNQ